jgi:hypothetical protein
MARGRIAWLGHEDTRRGSTSGIEVYREDGAEQLVSFFHVAGWRAEMRLGVQNGRIVVSGLSVTPADPDALPAGGLTSRLLRRVPVHGHVAMFSRWLSAPPYRREQLEALLIGTGLESMLTAQPAARSSVPRRGRPPVSTDVLLQVAKVYAKAVTAGSLQPVQDAAKTLRMPMLRVRDYVHRCRRMGLLTSTAWGRSGGALTDYAKTLLTPPSRTQQKKRRRR